jgi:hypothetical protein
VLGHVRHGPVARPGPDRERDHGVEALHPTAQLAAVAFQCPVRGRRWVIGREGVVWCGEAGARLPRLTPD